MINNHKSIIAKNLLKILIIIAIGFLLINIFISKYSIGFNNSNSIEGKIFFVAKDSYPQVISDKIIFKVNNIHTNYEDKIFIKKVIGFEGDTVSVRNNNIFLNEKYLGKIKSQSIKNNQLYPIIANNQSLEIPKDQYFVYSSHIDSYDSRYKSTGLIKRSMIIGGAYEIF